jgi:3-carboxy-cis,cis-muconate cycloisomerase
MFTSESMQAAVSDESWLRAMLDVEAALARAQARAGVIPGEAAEAITAYCATGRFDLDQLGQAAIAAGNPVIPLIEALKAVVPSEAAGHVHRGATSQDILDTATMFIVRRGLELIQADLDGVAAACAGLAETHRSTMMPGRTLLQQAIPITFGLKAAGWLTAVLEVQASLVDIRGRRLAVQLGGAAGSLASFGASGIDIIRYFAEELSLAEPVMPWHTNRTRIAEVAAALAITAGAAGKIALDVSLLMQTEIAEVAERPATGRGRSSAMPQKRNPVAAVAVNAAVRRAQALAGVIFTSMAQEHERAAGAWQAEWQTMSELLALTGGAVSRVREILEGLEVDPARMRANLFADGGLAMAEQVVTALTGRIDSSEARELVESAADLARARGLTLRDALHQDASLVAIVSAAELDGILEPSNYTGSSGAFIDRATAAYRNRQS